MYQGNAFDTHVRIVAMSIKELTRAYENVHRALEKLEMRLQEVAGQIDTALSKHRTIVERA